MALGGLTLLASAALLALQPAPVDDAVAALGENGPGTRVMSCEQTCALPAGVELHDLSGSTASYLAKRAQLCADFECGRIDADSYAKSLAALDAEPPAPPLPEQLWATSVRAVSSQYGEHDWSAAQALGAPDVHPSHGDNVKAWAPSIADGKSEFIEVGVPASRISGVALYETYNPGAVRNIQLIANDGTRTSVGFHEPRVSSESSRINATSFACTGEEIVAVRVELAPSTVPGWNEIDAIAVRPCR